MFLLCYIGTEGMHVSYVYVTFMFVTGAIRHAAKICYILRLMGPHAYIVSLA